MSRGVALLIALFVALVSPACSKSHTSAPHTSVAQARAIATRACGDWRSLHQRSGGRLPSQSDVDAIERTANDATNGDLEFVVLTDHIHVAALAVHNSDRSAWNEALRRVDDNCARISDGTYREHLNDSG